MTQLVTTSIGCDRPGRLPTCFAESSEGEVFCSDRASGFAGMPIHDDVGLQVRHAEVLQSVGISGLHNAHRDHHRAHNNRNPSPADGSSPTCRRKRHSCRSNGTTSTGIYRYDSILSCLLWRAKRPLQSLRLESYELKGQVWSCEDRSSPFVVYIPERFRPCARFSANFPRLRGR